MCESYEVEHEINSRPFMRFKQVLYQVKIHHNYFGLIHPYTGLLPPRKKNYATRKPHIDHPRFAVVLIVDALNDHKDLCVGYK